jgi:sialate O-acetylesterase
MNKRFRCLGALALTLLPFAASAAIELPLLFSNGMVLQREQPIRVWGWATPGDKIDVAFDGRTAQAVAEADGRWTATLPLHIAGGPFELAVSAGKQKLVIHDVLVGDVWIASGQSNMEFELSKASNAAVEIANAHDPMIRQFKVPDSWSLKPEDRLAGGSWVTASPKTAGDFTAVGYFFARELRADVHVPIGLINTNWGGSRIEAWMDARTAVVDPDTLARKLQQDKAAVAEELNEARERLKPWPNALHAGVAEDRAAWAAPGLDESDWIDVPVPMYWEQFGFPDMDGIAWYRTSFELTAEEAASGISLGVGMVDDEDQTWVNGKPVGAGSGWNTPRIYRVAPKALHAGRNTLAVRVNDLGAGGGIHGDAALLYVQSEGGTRHPLATTWKFKPSSVVMTTLDDKNQIGTLLYNKMIHPLLPYGVKGVIWYQGEANAEVPLAYAYRTQFVDLIRQWRQDFGQENLPFLWVQLANFGIGTDTEKYSPWALLRESQSAALTLPATGQAVTIDVGNPANIHPTNKQAVGHRLALAARHTAYGETLVYSGPVYRDMQIDGSKATLTFELFGGALAARGGGSQVQGFEVAGGDHRFRPAQATMDGDKVTVSNDAVAHPVAVRYAWNENPEHADLVNSDGLPASPFRTDTW